MTLHVGATLNPIGKNAVGVSNVKMVEAKPLESCRHAQTACAVQRSA